MQLLPFQVTPPVLLNETKSALVIKACKGEKTIGVKVLGISVGGEMMGEVREDEEVGENCFFSGL